MRCAEKIPLFNQQFACFTRVSYKQNQAKTLKKTFKIKMLHNNLIKRQKKVAEEEYWRIVADRGHRPHTVRSSHTNQHQRNTKIHYFAHLFISARKNANFLPLMATKTCLMHDFYMETALFGFRVVEITKLKVSACHSRKCCFSHSEKVIIDKWSTC